MRLATRAPSPTGDMIPSRIMAAAQASQALAEPFQGCQEVWKEASRQPQRFVSIFSSLQVRLSVDSGPTSDCPKVMLRPLFVQRGHQVVSCRQRSQIGAAEWDHDCSALVSEVWDDLSRHLISASCGEPLLACGECT